MAVSNPNIHSYPESPVIIHPDAIGNYFARYGMTNEQIKDVTISLVNGRPTDTNTTPDPMGRVDISFRRYTEHMQLPPGYQIVTVYDENLIAPPSDAEDTPNQRLAEGLSTVVDHAILGATGIQKERRSALRRAYLKGLVRPGLGTAALGAAEVTLYELGKENNFDLPNGIAILGLVVLGAAVIGTEGVAATARSRAVRTMDTFRTWPDQRRARERGNSYEKLVKEGAAEPLATSRTS